MKKIKVRYDIGEYDNIEVVLIVDAKNKKQAIEIADEFITTVIDKRFFGKNPDKNVNHRKVKKM